MKKIVLIIALVIIIGIVIGCIVYNFNSNEENFTNQGEQLNTEIANDETLLNSNEVNNNTGNTLENSPIERNENSMGNARLRLTVNGREMFVTLEDNQASRDLLEMLPLTLTFEDYNNTEKIATLPSELSTEGSPSGYTPGIGDFAYYAPWGNLSLFYEDFRYSNSLIKLGTFESSIEEIGNINEDFEVTIERVN